MKTFVAKLGLVLLLLASCGFGGELVDRLVASVDNVPILQSEWDHAVALEALEQGRTVASYTEPERLAVLDRLVDQQLIRAQMGDERAGAADEAEIAKQIATIRAALSQAQNDDDWNRLLAQYGLKEDALRRKVARELQVMRFIDLRLRPGARVDRDEVETYYTETLLPQLRKEGVNQEQSLSQLYSKIEEILRQQRIDALLATWLQQLHEQSDIQWIGVRAAPAPDTASASPSGGH